jgi:phage tail sheath protein FI
MPEYFAPGVYVLEVPGSPPIAGVGTSTAAFIGELDTSPPFQMPLKAGTTERHEVAKSAAEITDGKNPAILVTNFDQFKQSFGDFQAGNQTLAHAVFGFFLNGGTRCWVVHVPKPKPEEAPPNRRYLDGVDLTKALAGLEKIDEIAIVAAPGALDTAVQGALIDHCEKMQDRFALLDGQRTTAMTVEAIKGRRTKSTPSKTAIMRRFISLGSNRRSDANPNRGATD